jgi:hypothetical protein
MKKRTAQFPLVGGQDARTSPQLLLAPRVTAATNLYRARTAEWTKRNGFHYLPNVRISQEGAPAPFSFAKARALGGRGDELVLIDKKRWWSYTALRGGFVNLSQSSPGDGLDIDQRLVTHRLGQALYRASEGAESAIAVDSAVGNGYVCTIWQTDQNRIKIVFTEEATGNFVGSQSATTAVTRRPKVVHTESRFVVFSHTQGGGSCTLHADHWDSANVDGPSYVGGNNVATDLMGTSTGEPWYDVQVRSTGNILIAYRSTAPSVKALEWDPTSRTASIAAATVVAGDVAANALGWVYDAADVGGTIRLLTAQNTATGVVERELNGATLVQSAGTIIQASPGDVASIAGYRAAGDTWAFWELRNADVTLTSVVEGHTGIALVRTFMGIGCLATKPFKVDSSDWYIGVTKPWELQPGYFIVPARHLGGNQRVPPGVTARILPGAGMALPPERNALSHVPGVTTTRFVFPCMRIYDFTRPTTTTFFFYRAALYATVDFDAPVPRPVSYSKTLLVPGSVTKSYAGDGVSDGGWMVAPEAPTLASGGVGALVGTYRYKLVLAVTDGEGRIWRSAASPEASFLAASNLIAVTLKYPFLSSAWIGLSYQTTVGVVEVYRTKANGTTYFRLPGAVGSAPYPLLGTTQTTTFNDQLADNILEQNLPLYTDGGELFNEPAPPCISMAAVGLRMVGIPAEDLTSVVASKEVLPGFAVGFHPDLRLPIVADGDNYAVAAMENRTIVFKRQAIYILTGDWPNALGLGSLPIAQRVAVGFGTINASSVRESQDGVWFEDPAKGMCLLTRGLDVVQIGKPVQDDDATALVGIDVAEDDEQVRALLADRKVLIYDTLEKQWATWQFDTALGTPTCAAVVNGVYYQGFSNGRVSFYNLASFADNAGSGSIEVLCTLLLRFSLAGVEGVQRIYRLMATGRKFASPTTLLTGRFDLDYIAGTPSAGVDPASFGGFWRHSWRPPQGRCSTFNFRLQYGSASQGMSFAAIALEYGLRDQPGLFRLPASSQS